MQSFTADKPKPHLISYFSTEYEKQQYYDSVQVANEEYYNNLFSQIRKPKPAKIEYFLNEENMNDTFDLIQSTKDSNEESLKSLKKKPEPVEHRVEYFKNEE